MVMPRTIRAWVVEIGEPLPGIDGSVREWRCGMLVKALLDRGHGVTWWASTFDHFARRHRFTSGRVVERSPRFQIRLLHGPGYGRSSSPRRFLHHRRLAGAFARDARKVPAPDVVFCCLPALELAEQSVSFGAGRGVPVVVDIRDTWPEHYLTLVPGALRRVARLVLATEFRRARRILQGGSGITAISPSFLRWGLGIAGREPREEDGVFEMGYPEPSAEERREAAAIEGIMRERYGLPEDVMVVTYVGSFSPSYDFRTVIEAARILERDGRDDIWFVLVGGGGGEAAVQSEARGMSNVVLTGWFDQVSIRAMLTVSSVGLAPYSAKASMSLPNKPFEYMAFGLPLLSSLTGDLEELVRSENIGVHYTAGDPRGLAACVARLADDPGRRGEMGRRARRLFEERFRATKVYPRLAEHLEMITSARCGVESAG